MRRRLRWTIAGLVPVGLVGGGVAALAVSGDGSSPRTSTVRAADVRSTVTLSGSLAPAATYSLYFGAALAVTGPPGAAEAGACEAAPSTGRSEAPLGPVTSLSVTVGSRVTAGQLLAEADSAAAQADLDAARKELQDAEDLLAKHRAAAAAPPPAPLFDSAPGATVITPTAAPEAALIGPDQDRAARARARVADLQRTVDSARLTAPVDGVVQQLTTAPGATPSCRTPVLVLRSEALRVRVDAPAELLGRLHPGQRARVVLSTAGPTADTSVEALPVVGVTVPGSSVGPYALPQASAPPLTAYPLDLPLPAPPAGALPGIPATATITLAQRSSVLAVPTAAVERDGGAAYVSRTACAPEGPTCRTGRVVVRLGLAGDELTEITSGLAPGDVVALPDE